MGIQPEGERKNDMGRPVFQGTDPIFLFFQGLFLYSEMLYKSHICMKHLTLIKARTADPAWLLYIISVYKNRPWKNKKMVSAPLKTGLPMSFFLSPSGWIPIWNMETHQAY